MDRIATLLALTLSLAACAAPEGYPSLLPRASERIGFEEPATPAPDPLAPDPALDARLTTLSRAAEESAARFDITATRAERQARAARGAAAGSDAWLDAHTVLAELDVARAETLEQLTDLDQLAADRALTLAADYPALEAALTATRDRATAQAARIATLQAMLAPA